MFRFLFSSHRGTDPLCEYDTDRRQSASPHKGGTDACLSKKAPRLFVKVGVPQGGDILKVSILSSQDLGYDRRRTFGHWTTE